MTLGERLIQLRAKAGLSQDDLAERLGVSRQSVSKWENNVSVPDLDKLVKLGEVFGVSLDELVRGNVPGPADPIAKAGVTAEELRLHRQRLLGLLLLFASVLLGSRSEGTWGILFAWPLVTCGILCLLCRRPLGLLCAWGAWLTHFVSLGASVVYIFGGTRLDNFLALTLIIPLGFLTVYSLRHPLPISVCWLLLASFLYQYPKYLVAFWRTSRLFRSVPSFCASIRRKISDAVLAGNVSAGELLLLADAGLPATFGKSQVRIVVHIKNIPKRILSLQKTKPPERAALRCLLMLRAPPRSLPGRGASSAAASAAAAVQAAVEIRHLPLGGGEELLELVLKGLVPRRGGSGCCARGAAWG